MADFITKNDKVIPINRTATGTQLNSSKLLPTEESSDDKTRKSKKALQFAGNKAKTFASITRATGEKLKNRHIQKSINQRSEDETLDREVDDILDDQTSSDSRKFRLLQRFGLLNRKRLSKQQLKVVNDSLKELDQRISKQRESGRGGMTNPREESILTPTASEGLTSDQFNKLPEQLKEQIRVQSLR